VYIMPCAWEQRRPHRRGEGEEERRATDSTTAGRPCNSAPRAAADHRPPRLTRGVARLAARTCTCTPGPIEHSSVISLLPPKYRNRTFL
jgi:hypothetical protein